MRRPRINAFLLLIRWMGKRFDRIDQHLADIAQAVRIYGDHLMSQNDDLLAAIADLSKNVTHLEARIAQQSDLTPAINAVKAVSDQVNALAQPAAPVPTPEPPPANG